MVLRRLIQGLVRQYSPGLNLFVLVDGDGVTRPCPTRGDEAQSPHLNELSRRRGAALFVLLCRRFRSGSLGQRARLNAVVTNSVVVDEIHFVQDDRANDRDDQGYVTGTEMCAPLLRPAGTPTMPFSLAAGHCLAHLEPSNCGCTRAPCRRAWRAHDRPMGSVNFWAFASVSFSNSVRPKLSQNRPRRPPFAR
jgi:hypothetical protein